VQCFRAAVPPEAVSTCQGASLTVHFCAPAIDSSANCVRYSLRVYVVPAASAGEAGQIAAVLPPRGLPTKRLFLRLRTTRFISRSETLLSMLTAPSEQNTFSSVHWPSGSATHTHARMSGLRLEIAFIVFLFYSNLLMGEITPDGLCPFLCPPYFKNRA